MDEYAETHPEYRSSELLKYSQGNPDNPTIVVNMLDELGFVESDLNGVTTRRMHFGPDGAAYITVQRSPDALYERTGVYRLDVTALDPTPMMFASSQDAFPEGLFGPSDCIFGLDGNLYVSLSDHSVARYEGPGDPSSEGSYLDTFVPSWAGDRTSWSGMRIGPDGDLYLGDYVEPYSGLRVLRYDGATGTYLHEFAVDASANFGDYIFDPNGDLLMADGANGRILRLAGPYRTTDEVALPVTVYERATYASDDVPQRIGNKQVTAELEVTEAFTIQDVDVQLDITHPSTSALDVFLVAPDGTRVELFTDVSGSGFVGTVLDDEAHLSITSGSSPFDGSTDASGGRYMPEGKLGAFDGKLAAGVWTLEITPDSLGYRGTLNAWSLTFAREAGVSTNSPPVANEDSAITSQDASVTIDVLANDSDADGDTISLVGVGAAANGAVTLNGDGTVTYTPVTGFTGTDTFNYTISDGNGGTATATVTVQVNGTQPSAFLIDDVSKREGRTGKDTTFTFTVTRTGDTSQAVTVYYATAAGEETDPRAATEGDDYVAASGWLTFAEGETTKSVSVTVKGDLDLEYDEFFFLRLSLTDQDLTAIATGTGTIVNDDK